MKKKGAAFWLPIIIIIVCLVFLAVCWFSTTVSDLYVTYVFPVITGAYGRLTSLADFSVGEKLLVFVVCFIAFCILFIITRIIAGRFFKEGAVDRHTKAFSRYLIRFSVVLLTITAILMTFNCFVLYHTSGLQVKNSRNSEDYTIEDLATLRDYVVKKCNELSEVVPHDENGNVKYDGDMKSTAIEAMQNLGSEYPRLSGYYVTPKALYFSDFMCQQYMQGYYFPFSMEANYNDKMNLMNKPFTMCHELAHTHGYIYEDEANFFGFLACIDSEDIVFQYSGYLGVLNYINNDFYRAVSKEEYNSHVKISDRVKYDNEFVSQEGWKEIEENAILPTETVKKAADTFIDTNLKVNGVSSGKASYSHVVGLIMDYYSDVLLADAG